MHDTTIAAKLLGQLNSFLGRISPRFLLSMGLDFIVRLKERHVKSWKRKVLCGELAIQCRMLHREVVEFNHHGEERRVTIEFGVVPVRLPDRLLHMVVVRCFGKQPMMLLTTLAQNTSREALWQVVEGHITRWRVEDTIRHVKQSYKLENIRLFKYDKLKAMAALVLATIYFSMVWIDNSEKHAVIARMSFPYTACRTSTSTPSRTARATF